MKSSILLRQWHDADMEPFASMNADAEVMRFFPRPLTAQESREAMQRFRQGIEQRGWGLWAVEVDGDFAGFTGLSEPKFSAHFTPCVEVGWRLRREFWGRGIAFAAAQQAVDYAFSILHLEQLVSFTTASNLKSRKLMERLGFTHHSDDDFMHPLLEEDHPLRHHVLYRKCGSVDSL
ncbi:RimJ/RimL family protein N-acetyltransferase [Roseimicrobium gellanilyticum]|uniref:RimJ/RimL family protein N-acetyltransferase n=1 Tax=Roseimicrobium gellanilyticum TaxID=748857 RepID=A0A366H704_9BACT|nr:GNAT family N-acetyltransferase [Roseimicrobium gellanilyticum]RBP37784.1 RimJ/RimL family protein N-acetyltransferase [Roseimicrobium gellanilyticum]